MGQQFQDADFPALSGARIVRIAVHPELGRAGYGSRALELLRRYYEVSFGVKGVRVPAAGPGATSMRSLMPLRAGADLLAAMQTARLNISEARYG